MNRFHLEQSQNFKQIQRLILTREMQQALHLLQLPVLELSQVIYEEMQHNPLLEIEEEETSSSEEFEAEEKEECEIDALFDFNTSSKASNDEEDSPSLVENLIAYEQTLEDYLLHQARETFLYEKELSLAEILIGNFDEHGFISTDIEDLALIHGVDKEELLTILEEIQNFDPPGVGARNLQESLLIQLRRSGRGNSLAFKIVEGHFSSMLHNKIPLIAKSLKTTPKKVKEVIEKEISRLDLHPGLARPSSKTERLTHLITPDAIIHETEEGFAIEVSEDGVPPLKLSRSYLRMLQDENLPKETKDYIMEKIAGGKWLLRNIHERHNTLYRITEEILKIQRDFFSSPGGKLHPLTMKAVSLSLELHESTIARAVANKYLSSPRGIFPLRYFFSNAYVTDSGDILSSKTVKELLKEIVEKEDRACPFSDETLSLMIKEKGIPCARRTVAKYRQELGIGSTVQRKSY